MDFVFHLLVLLVGVLCVCSSGNVGCWCFLFLLLCICVYVCDYVHMCVMVDYLIRILCM